MADLNAVVQRYVELRDLKASLSTEFKNKAAEIDAGMEKIEKFFLLEMEKNNLEALPTEAGTPYKSTKTSATVADWPSFLAWVQENGRWELLTRGASKDAVKAFREEQNDLPPGINWREEIVVNVRRS